MIDGVIIKKLTPIPDERGWVMEMLRSDDEFFEKFGQVYLTTAYPGVVKGWHYHKRQTDNFVVISGMAKVVLYDGREKSKTRGEVMELFMGEKNPLLVKIPPFVYHGFKGIGTDPAYIVNTPTLPYNHKNPDEYRLPADTDKIPYDWNIKQK